MFFVRLRTWFHSRTGWEKAAAVVWCAILLFVCVRVFLHPTRRTVYPLFSASGELWWASGELYEPHRPKEALEGYRYAPICAILFTPFAFMPDSIGGVLWRLVSMGALFAAFAWFARAVLPGSLSGRSLALMFLLAAPLSLQSVNNGQANMLVIAAMLGAVAAVAEERWNLASILIAIAVVFKLYPLALGLTLMVLYPRQLGWRIPLACAAAFLAPFLTQPFDYVVDQYAKWIALLRSEDRSDIGLEHMYRDLWLLIHLYGLPISRTAYLVIQVLGGAIVAVVCWQRQRSGWLMPRLLTATLALTTAWMMLLGPATESSSFALLAPSFAWSIVEAVGRIVNPSGPAGLPIRPTRVLALRHGLLWCSCALFTVALVVGGIAKDLGVHEAGVHAWASLCYFAYLLTEPRAAAVAEVEPVHYRSLAA